MSDKEAIIDHKAIGKVLDDFLKHRPGTKFLVLGGTHQDELDHYKIFSDPTVVHTLKKHGLHTLAWECPTEFQKHAEKVIWDGMDAKTFGDVIGEDKLKAGRPQSKAGREGYELQVPMLLAQKKLGNVFIYYDSPNKNLKAHYDETHSAVAQEDTAKKLAFKKAEAIWTDTYISLQEGGMRHSDENESRAFVHLMNGYYKTDPAVKAAHEAFLRLRISSSDERARAEHIKAHSVGGAAVWAGAAHGSTIGDLDEQLDDAPRLVIVRDKADYIETSQRDYTLGNEAPEGYLIASEGKIISGTAAYQSAREFSQAYDKALKGITPQVSIDVPATGLKENQPVTMKP